jgi:asparagine synthase (glutamine-hydrolysing)
MVQRAALGDGHGILGEAAGIRLYMCGIAGKVGLSRETVVSPALVRRMTDAIRHRGPDDDGIYIEPQAVLGHRRLSIIDLNTGKQPISNEDGTIWIVYNGEIYNFRELRNQLLTKGHFFKTHTDTEVIVHLYEEFGEECMKHLRGMFAFALWDARKKKLLLVRDRVGIKPLYYAETGDSLLFASEIKALLVDPDLRREVAPQAIDTFLTFNYLPGPDTLLRGIRKLEPGHYLVLEGGQIRTERYWDLEFPSEKRNGDFRSAAEELNELLRRTVRDHMISDVPVGILLSGGVDSTALLSFIVRETNEDIKSFTIGFSGEEFADERYYATLAAQKFGSRHYQTTITARDFEEFLPKYVWHMEEPVCEPPAVALYYVTKLAREHVKVLMSGEGGDEAFAGYQNYRNAVWVERMKSLGQPWTAGASHGLRQLARIPGLGRLKKFPSMMDLPLERYYYSRTSSPFSFFRRTKASFYTSAFQQALDQDFADRQIDRYFANVCGKSALDQMLYVDTKTWLPDDLLIKADKITMANSLELRVPLLDHKVLEFAASLPSSYKVHGFTTKYILKKVFDGRVPAEILKRKKTGFPVPIQSWLAKDLKDFTHDLLLDRKSIDRGYFEKSAIEELLAANETGRADHSAEIFSLITLELWQRRFVDSQGDPLPVRSGAEVASAFNFNEITASLPC